MSQLRTDGAKQLAITTPGKPVWENVTPKWFLSLLPMVSIDNETYIVNKVSSINKISADHDEDAKVNIDSIDYDHQPVSYKLDLIQSIIRLPSRVVDLLNVPHDQMEKQFSLTIENLMELKENRMINGRNGLITYAIENKRHLQIEHTPTPNDMDNMIASVWKHPSFFIMNPLTMSKFGHECTARGVCVGSVELFGNPLWSWRGIPILPSDKLFIDGGRTNVLLVRVGEDDNGIFEIYNKRHIYGTKNGIKISEINKLDKSGMVNYMVSAYFGLVISSIDAIYAMECNINTSIKDD